MNAYHVDIALIVENKKQILTETVGSSETKADKAHGDLATNLETTIRQNVLLKLFSQAHMLTEQKNKSLNHHTIKWYNDLGYCL